ncbi:MAG: hypothetical protein KF872_03020 [Chitinophagales bacterium]|nr:hypothetical protein [Chitinophagales bacterium]
MKKLISLLGLVLLLHSSCSYSDTWEVVNVNNEFSADIPSWMDKTDELKDGAPLQYRNRFRNVYFLVIKDKQDSLPAFPVYAAQNISVLKRAVEHPIVSDSATAELGGLVGVHAEVMGNMGEEKIFYTHYSLQGKNGYNYQVCIWTRGEERKLRYNEEMHRMIQSFKLLQ